MQTLLKHGARGRGHFCLDLKAVFPISVLVSFNQSNPVKKKKKLDHLTSLLTPSWGSCLIWSWSWILTMTREASCDVAPAFSLTLLPFILHMLWVLPSVRIPQIHQAHFHLWLCKCLSVLGIFFIPVIDMYHSFCFSIIRTLSKCRESSTWRYGIDQTVLMHKE